MRPSRSVSILLVCAALVIGWSAIQPRDYGVWWFETWPSLLGMASVAAVSRRARISGLLCLLIGLHITVLAAGAKYTYAEMPLFDWLRVTFGLARNHYDRAGHFMQGFVPALVCREVLLRTSAMRPGKMLFFICTSVCLGLSALWELIEMWTVELFYPNSGPEWLGMQGDPWDAQHDMLMALAGAALSLLLLSRAHDRSLAKIQQESPRQSAV